jgi:hypothetical protein
MLLRLTRALKIFDMMPGVLCLIVLAMPLAVAICASVSAARTNSRPVYAKAEWLGEIAEEGVADVHDDSTLPRVK